MSSLLTRAERRLGFRGQRLVLFGVVWVLMGVSVATNPLAARPDEFLLVHEMLPEWPRAVVWIVTGAVAVVFGLWGERMPCRDDGWGWAALTLMPTFRLFSWLFSWVAWAVTSLTDRLFGTGVYGDPTAITGALVYLVIVLLVSTSAQHHCPPVVEVDTPRERRA